MLPTAAPVRTSYLLRATPQKLRGAAGGRHCRAEHPDHCECGGGRSPLDAPPAVAADAPPDRVGAALVNRGPVCLDGVLLAPLGMAVPGNRPGSGRQCLAV